MIIRGLTFKNPTWHGLENESRAFARCFYPHTNNNTFTKLISLIFVIGWVIITIALTLEDIPTIRPIFYGIYTAIVFLILGRIWQIELDKLVN